MTDLVPHSTPREQDMAKRVFSGEQRSAQVSYDRETGRLIVALDMTDEELPTEFDIASVTVQLAYPDGSPNYGERNFRQRY